MLGIEEIAMKALYVKGGVTRLFTNADYPSPAICKKAALSFRNTLYTLKAKERRRQRRKLEGKGDETVYDELSAIVEETPTGWKVTFCKVTFDPNDFINDEGEPINWERSHAFD